MIHHHHPCYNFATPPYIKPSIDTSSSITWVGVVNTTKWVNRTIADLRLGLSVHVGNHLTRCRIILNEEDVIVIGANMPIQDKAVALVASDGHSIDPS
jgi:hypothetical protein